jgi:hypothetical protein
LKRSGTTFHKLQSTAWSTLCEGDIALHETNGGPTRYCLVFWSTPIPLFLKISLTNICIFVFPVMWNT